MGQPKLRVASSPSPSTHAWQLPAVELAERVRRGELTALDAVEACIARTEEVNPRLNALVVERFEAARAEARALDGRRAAGQPLGPLAGVPIAIKECLDVAGTPTTCGVPARARVNAAADDACVARLKAAGAIVIGKTNVAQLLMFLESDNPLYGRTDNPWDPTRSPGGSSGGQSALLAAGGCALGLGTDIGGSLRVPAAFTGTASIKPTTGRLDDPGALSMPRGQRAIVSQVGPMARTVDDLALALAILNDPARPLGDPTTVSLRGLRVGLYTDDGVFPASAACARAPHEAADLLAKQGAEIVPFTIPDGKQAQAIGFGIFSADRFAGMKRTLGDAPRDPRIKLLELSGSASRPKLALLKAMLRLSGRRRTAEIIDAFGHADTDHFWQLCEAQLGYQARFTAAVDEARLDLLIGPACGVPAVPHGATAELGVVGMYTFLYNLLGWPAGVVPVTRVRDDEQTGRPASREKMERAAIETDRGSAGLPVGAQVIARPWQEHLVLAAMRAIEAGARVRPDFPHTPVS